MRAFRLGSPAATQGLRAMILGGTAMAALLSSPALAQQAADAEANDGGIADIIVTAERRATNLQDTPLSIIAVTQETIEAKGIDDLQDLAAFTPNLTITPSRGGGNNSTNFVIRGIGGGGGATGERGVGLYIDGIYMPRTAGAVLRVLDIDRVEVLRGPQGTLFGRNSTGGAVRLFSKQPTNTTEGYLRGTIGTIDRYDIIGMINLPVGENFAIRAQAAYLEQGGFVRRGTEMLGKQSDTIGRLQARYDSGRLTATAGFLYTRSKSNGTPNVMTEFDMRPGIEPGPGFAGVQGNYADWMNDAFKAAGGPPLAAYNDPRVVKTPFETTDVCLMDDFNPDYDAACNQFLDSEYWQADLNLKFEVSDNLSLTSISGYGKLKHRGTSDYEGIGMETRAENVDSTVYYNELQANAGLFGGKVDIVAGANYFREDSSSPNVTIVRRGTSVYPAAANGNGDAGLFRTADIFIKQIANSYGLFWSTTWHVTDKLNITSGARKAWDDKKYRQTRQAATDLTVAPGTTSTTVSTAGSFDALDYRGTIDYHFTDDIMAYATISKAYKAGSYSYTIAGWTAANQATGERQSAGIKPIPNEKVVNYEAGLRMSLFDRRLRINPTAFIMDYTNRQAAVQVTCTSLGIPASQCPVGFVIQVQNQGDVRLKGVELDMQLALLRNLVIDASGGFTDSTLKNAPAGTVNLYPDVASPTFNIGATFTDERPWGKATVNLNYSYNGSQKTHPSEGTDSSYTLPAYGLFNARVHFALKNVPMTIAAYANNLMDKTYAVYAQRFGGGFWDSGAGTGVAAPPRSALSEVRGRPREIGLTVQYNF